MTVSQDSLNMSKLVKVKEKREVRKYQRAPNLLETSILKRVNRSLKISQTPLIHLQLVQMTRLN